MSRETAIERRVLRKMGRAISDFRMIDEDDRILVALSGGKDSWTLLHCLHALRRRAPIRFSVAAVTVDAGYPGFDAGTIAAVCAEHGFSHRILTSPIRDILDERLEPGSSPCAFCARLRRGALYGFARREGYTKLALGHHADDLIETLLLGEFFSGEIKSMPPILDAEDGVNVLIRPLCYVFEETIAAFAAEAGYPAVACSCPLQGRHDRKRRRVKTLLAELEAEHPSIKSNLLSSLGRVRSDYLMRRRPRPSSG